MIWNGHDLYNSRIGADGLNTVISVMNIPVLQNVRSFLIGSLYGGHLRMAHFHGVMETGLINYRYPSTDCTEGHVRSITHGIEAYMNTSTLGIVCYTSPISTSQRLAEPPLLLL
jgi:hypothetical protein